MKRAQGLGAILGALVAGLRCQPIPATEVLVRFAADAELKSRAARLKVEVRSREGAVVLEREKALGGGESELARVPVVPHDEDSSRFFSVRGELFDSSGASLGVERAMLGFVEDELSEVLLVFDVACEKTPDCGEGQRCQSGSCVGACVDAVSGHVAQETPARCSTCQRCGANRCEPLEDGAACGCAGDTCLGGTCNTPQPILSVALGIRHTCAMVDDEGPLYCWGLNADGQLGIDPGEARRTSPTFVDRPRPGQFWKKVLAKSNTTCIHAGDDSRICWGDNGLGQFGDKTLQGSVTPVPIADPPVTELTAGGNHFCGIKETGDVVWCWGNEWHGALGGGPTPDTSIPQPTPEHVRGLDQPDPTVKTSAIEGGGAHTCAILTDGTLNCWGFNASGQLGVGDTQDRGGPVRVGCTAGPTGEVCSGDWGTVSLGTYHTCGIKSGDELWCWGGNNSGQLGVGTNTESEILPLHVSPENGWKSIAAGYQHSCAIRGDASLWCWGNGEQGQLGTGERDRTNLPVRVPDPPGPERWVSVFVSAGPGGDVGGMHTCALRSNQTLWCWGLNDEGQIGLGFTSESVTTPRRVCLPP